MQSQQEYFEDPEEVFRETFSLVLPPPFDDFTRSTSKIYTFTCTPGFTASCSRIESRIRLLAVICLFLALVLTLCDVLNFLQYRHTMADFQLAWLYFNFSALICLLIVLLYGFHALGKKTYHSASNFRSWLLFIGTSLFFSGFFHIIGQDELDVLPDDKAVHSYQYCFKIFHTFLICFVVIWATHSVVMLSLFFYVNQYKNENFYEEEEAAEEAHEIECEKRKFRPERSLPVRIQVQPPTPSTLDSAGLSTGSDLSW